MCTAFCAMCSTTPQCQRPSKWRNLQCRTLHGRKTKVPVRHGSLKPSYIPALFSDSNPTVSSFVFFKVK